MRRVYMYIYMTNKHLIAQGLYVIEAFNYVFQFHARNTYNVKSFLDLFWYLIELAFALKICDYHIFFKRMFLNTKVLQHVRLGFLFIVVLIYRHSRHSFK